MSKHERSTDGGTSLSKEPWDDLTAGYRFFVVERPDDAREALDLRRSVYATKLGQEPDVPDAIDERAWLLAAEHLPSKQIVGTMRLAPSDLGALECEEFFDLPLRLRQGLSVEITRFSVSPLHRKKPGALPPVSLGLFRLSTDVCREIDAKWVVIASRPEQIETYVWLAFERTGVLADYGALGGSSHELLWHDFQKDGSFATHPLEPFFGPHPRAEIQLPSPLPQAGDWLRRMRRGSAAAAGRTS